MSICKKLMFFEMTESRFTNEEIDKIVLTVIIFLASLAISSKNILTTEIDLSSM